MRRRWQKLCLAGQATWTAASLAASQGPLASAPLPTLYRPSNPLQVARTQGARAGLAQVAKRRLLPAPAPQPNSGSGPIALVGALLAASLYWSREGHKLRGRKLPPLLERLRHLLGGGTGGSNRRTVRSTAAVSSPAPPVLQQRAAAKVADRRALAAAAAEQRLRAQAQVQRTWGLWLKRRCGAPCTSWMLRAVSVCA